VQVFEKEKLRGGGFHYGRKDRPTASGFQRALERSERAAWWLGRRIFSISAEILRSEWYAAYNISRIHTPDACGRDLSFEGTLL
jgi:hypothetical protein